MDFESFHDACYGFQTRNRQIYPLFEMLFPLAGIRGATAFGRSSLQCSNLIGMTSCRKDYKQNGILGPSLGYPLIIYWKQQRFKVVMSE